MSSIAALMIILFVLLCIGVPVGYAIGGATMASIFFFSQLNPIINAQYCYSGISSFTVMSIPFFMLAGLIMSTGGIARRIVNFAAALIDFITGAIGCVTVLASIFFGALCGSGMATTSAIGGMMIPELNRKGYSPPYSATLVCFGGIVGPIIPPSLSMVIYGSVTNVSVAKLFIAGILPGIFLGMLFIVLNIAMCKKMGVDLRGGDTSETEVIKLPASVALKNRLKRIGRTGRDGIWALIAPVIILGGIYSGVFTPTEAACVSVVYSLVVSVFIYKEMDKNDVYNTILDAAVLNGITSFLLGYSSVFSTFMTYEKVPYSIAVFLTNVSDNRIIVLLLMNGILLVLGCFLDTVPAVIIMAPLLLPTAVQMGIDPIHFGIILAVNLSIGLTTPPYGGSLFVGAILAKTSLESTFKYVWIFLLTAVAGLLVITFVPQLSMAFL